MKVIQLSRKTRGIDTTRNQLQKVFVFLWSKDQKYKTFNSIHIYIYIFDYFYEITAISTHNMHL